MTIVSKKRKPDLFIPIICNSQWPESNINRFPHQFPSEPPALTTRVSNLYLHAIFDDIWKNVFCWAVGEILSLHLLVTSAVDDKIRTREDLYSLICAEIPDLYQFPLLYQTYLHNNV